MTRRRSMLQSRMLVLMRQDATLTTTGMAWQLGVDRRSAARSVFQLEGDALVCRGGEGWTLTHSGWTESRECKARLEQMLKDAEAALTFKGGAQ